jgi:hypothetical protein
MDTATEQRLIEKIRTLPLDQANEAVDFIDFLVNKNSKKKALNRLLALGQRSETSNLPNLDEAKLMQEIRVVRQARNTH